MKRFALVLIISITLMLFTSCDVSDMDNFVETEETSHNSEVETSFLDKLRGETEEENKTTDETTAFPETTVIPETTFVYETTAVPQTTPAPETTVIVETTYVPETTFVAETTGRDIPYKENYHGHVYTGGEYSKKFHYEAHCAGKNSHEITWEEVDRRGLEPCGTCVLK